MRSAVIADPGVLVSVFMVRAFDDGGGIARRPCCTPQRSGQRAKPARRDASASARAAVDGENGVLASPLTGNPASSPQPKRHRGIRTNTHARHSRQRARKKPSPPMRAMKIDPQNPRARSRASFHKRWARRRHRKGPHERGPDLRWWARPLAHPTVGRMSAPRARHVIAQAVDGRSGRVRDASAFSRAAIEGEHTNPVRHGHTPPACSGSVIR
jgi:hypothetical protein